MPSRTHYEVLQVDPAADPDVIRVAYRTLAAKLQPARDVTGQSAARLAELNRAFAVVGDPNARRAYDAQLSRTLTPTGPGALGGSTRGAGSLEHPLNVRHEAPGGAGTALDFGRYQGWTLGDLLNHDPDYLRWLARHSSGVRYRGAILRLLADHESSLAAAGRRP